MAGAGGARVFLGNYWGFTQISSGNRGVILFSNDCLESLYSLYLSLKPMIISRPFGPSPLSLWFEEQLRMQKPLRQIPSGGSGAPLRLEEKRRAFLSRRRP
jgi:hypothetical protein